MHNLVLEKNSDNHSASHRSTGPRTPEGKQASSQNALTHGCRSEKTVLRHEDPAEFEATIAGWFHLYNPQDPVALALVQQTARAHWFLKRAAKRLEDVEWELPFNAWTWTDEHQKLFGNFTRYKTAAERSFLRFYKELQAHYKRGECNRAELRENAFAELATVESQTAGQENTPPTAPPPEQPHVHKTELSNGTPSRSEGLPQISPFDTISRYPLD